jgi:hypothetical protein
MDELYNINSMDDIAALLNQIEPGSGLPENDTPPQNTTAHQPEAGNALNISDMLSYTHPYDDVIGSYHTDDTTQTFNNSSYSELNPTSTSYSIVDAMTNFADDHSTQFNLDLF